MDERRFQSRGAATEKDPAPQVHFEIGSLRSNILLERKLRDGEYTSSSSEIYFGALLLRDL